MSQDEFSLKEEIVRLRVDMKELQTLISTFLVEHKQNTKFRENAVNAIVGTAFLALASLGVAVAKMVGVIRF